MTVAKALRKAEASRTGGAVSRVMVFDHLHFAYQDSGFLNILMEGNLDAAALIPTGSMSEGPKFHQTREQA